MKHELEKPTPPHFMLFVILSGLNAVAMNIFLPSMPSLTESLNTQYSILQLTLTLYLFALAFSQLIIGPLSDKYGRRMVMLSFTVLFTIATFACAYSQNIEQLIIARVFQAIGGCAGIVVVRAIIKDLYSKEKAASFIGYTTMVVAILPMLAPILGGYIDEYYSWRESFKLVGILGLIGTIFTFINLKETNLYPVKKIDIKRIWIRYSGLAKNPNYRLYVLAMSFSTGAFYAFIAGAPFIATKILGLKPVEYGYYFVMVSLSYMLGNFISGKLSLKWGNEKLVMLAHITLLAAMVLLATFAYLGFQYPFMLFLPMAFVACANGISIPNSFAIALAIKPKIAGAASGLAGFVQICLGSLITYIVGLLHNDTIYPMVFMMLLTAAFCFLTSFLIHKRTKFS